MTSSLPSHELHLRFTSKSLRFVELVLALLASCHGGFGALTPPAPTAPLVPRYYINATYLSSTCAAKYLCNSGTQNVVECSCHPFCSLFDNCCQNARPANYAQLALSPSVYTCAAIADVTAQGLQTFGSLQSAAATPNFDSIYFVNKCPSSYKRDPTIRLCAHPIPALENGTLSAPVTDIYTGVTYRNAYCALCNNVGQFSAWGAYKVCRTPANSNSRSCSTGFLPPSHLVSWLHYCQLGTVQTCPDGSRLLRKQSCTDSPTQYVYDFANKVIYRNWNCTLCYDPPAPTWECARGWALNDVAPTGVTSEPLPTPRDYRCPSKLSAAMTAAEQQFFNSTCPRICAAKAGAGRRK